MALIDEVQNALAALPNVTCGSSRLGSGKPAWFVAGREFAHLHEGNVVDLRLPRKIQKMLRGDDRVRFRRTTSNWVEIELRRGEDVRWLADLASEATKPFARADHGT